MAIAVQTGAGNVTTAVQASANSISASKPSNTSNRDLLVAFVSFRNQSGTITTPSGWSVIGPVNTTNETFAAYAKPIPVAASEAATSYTFSTSAGSSRAGIIIFRVTGADLTGFTDAQSALAAYTGTSSIVLPAVTAASANALLLSFAMNNTTAGASAFSPPGGMTEITEITADAGGGVTMGVMAAYQVLSATGSTGTRTFSMSPNAANSGGFQVTLRAAPPTMDMAAVNDSTGWIATGGTAYAVISDDSDSTYITSPGDPVNVLLDLQLPGIAVPSSDLEVHLRIRKLDASSGTVVGRLYEGATLRSTSTSQTIPDSLGLVVVTFPIADLTAISTANWYSGLRLTLTVNAA